jgi:imidazolonepropionase-like amidohydrolase
MTRPLPLRAILRCVAGVLIALLVPAASLGAVGAPAASAAPAPAGAAPGVDDGALVIENVTVVDGTGGPPQPAMTVTIADGRFVSIVPAAAAAPGSGRRLDGRGRFLMPGLVDMHVHLQGGVVVTPEGLRKAARDRRRGEAALASYLYAGVTSIYDSGNDPDFVFALRDDERAGRIASPRLFVTGGIVTYPGSHGSGPGSTDIEAWPQARAALDAHLARRPDVLKLTLEERGWGARPMIPLLPEDLLRQAIRHANERGVRTTVHVSSELRAMEALYAGADALSHPVIQGPATEQYGRALAARGTPVVTTLTIGENYPRLVDHPEYLDEPLYRASIAADEIARLRTEQRRAWQDALWTNWMKLMTPVAMDNLRRLHEAGGVLVLGTDQTLGPAVHRELELLQQAGIPPLALTRIATLNGAIFLGRERDLGSIAVGKLADAVLLSADPTVDARNARAIVAVIKGGVPVDRDRLPLAGERPR